MKRRELFKFLAAAPAALVATTTKPEPEPVKNQDRIMVTLPPAGKPGSAVTIINLNDETVVVMK